MREAGGPRSGRAKALSAATWLALPACLQHSFIQHLDLGQRFCAEPVHSCAGKPCNHANPCAHWHTTSRPLFAPPTHTIP